MTPVKVEVYITHNGTYGGDGYGNRCAAEADFENDLVVECEVMPSFEVTELEDVKILRWREDFAGSRWHAADDCPIFEDDDRLIERATTHDDVTKALEAAAPKPRKATDEDITQIISMIHPLAG